MVIASAISASLGGKVGASDAQPAPAFTKTVTIERTQPGSSTPVETRTVTLNVSQTTNLKDQQNLNVSWTGAHPTGNISLDANSDTAVHDEYPMVLLQCRGVDSTSVPANQQVQPSTCWSPYADSRLQQTLDASITNPDYVGDFPPWRLDRYAANSDRRQFANLPPSTPDIATTCPGSASHAMHGLPFIAANGKSYYGTGGSPPCGPPPPEAAKSSADTDVTNLPDNATYAATHLDGTGSTLFSVRDAQTNASLGCSSAVPCSLVAIPVLGISCDNGAGLSSDDQIALPTQAETNCEAGGRFPAAGRQRGNGSDPATSVSGELWWSASNWRNRISVPLSFGPADDVCQLISAKNPVDVYGSEMLTQATTQWSAKLCVGANSTPFKQVQTSEAQARNLLVSGNIEAAFGSQPPTIAYATPTDQAPVAISGFAISFTIDDKNGNPLTSLALTPRLLAKLMTESYPASSKVINGYQYISPTAQTVKGDPDPIAPPPSNPLANNPKDITYDPEFMRLNPSVGHVDNADGGRDALLSLGTNSDVIQALTSYINADPEARAWLNGLADPWGMVVNPNYKGIALPVQNWPLLDTYTLPAEEVGSSCAAISPQTPFLTAIGAPLTRLIDIAQSVQYALPNARTGCSAITDLGGNVTYARYVRVSKQQPGTRFVIGLTSLGDAERYSLNTAALQTQVTSAGRNFVQPSMQSLKAAAALLSYDPTSGTWPVPYAALQTNRKATAAYPGMMVIYASIPTKGLPSADALAYGTLLAYLAGPGQVSGTAPGQLAAGFLPITKTNGLSQLADYTNRAALDVANQTAKVTPLVGPAAATTLPSVSPSPHALSVTTPAPVHQTPLAIDHSAPTQASPATSSPAAVKSSSASPTASPSPSATVLPPLKSLGKTSGQSATQAQLVLYLIIALLLLGPIGSPAIILALRVRRKK